MAKDSLKRVRKVSSGMKTKGVSGEGQRLAVFDQDGRKYIMGTKKGL